jgi:hypothetical protein
MSKLERRIAQLEEAKPTEAEPAHVIRNREQLAAWYQEMPFTAEDVERWRRADDPRLCSVLREIRKLRLCSETVEPL